MTKIKASVVQAATAAFNVDDTLDKLERLVKLAKERDNTQLCVFPEAFVGGYPKYQTFGALVGSRSQEGREEFLAYFNAAVAIPSPSTDRIGEIAKETGVFLVVGIIERAGSSLYCSVSFFSPQEGLVYTRRKLIPTGSERLIWA
jgi:predicted amidohydrolase